MLKRIIIFLTVVLIVLCFAANAYAFRCGKYNRNLAREGMSKHEILMDCGEPASSEVIGVDKRGGSYRKVEEQVYIIKDYGHKQVYRLKYDRNGIVEDIDWLGEQKP
jgi:hypothetical protein